ncbi:hypothetical protein H2203_008866 [Taxawa tesnikishii (nom. ined.)]|nr:hypothetical protein H2203_008866 [Dothideales sp. JES 119]
MAPQPKSILSYLETTAKTGSPSKKRKAGDAGLTVQPTSATSGMSEPISDAARGTNPVSTASNVTQDFEQLA